MPRFGVRHLPSQKQGCYSSTIVAIETKVNARPTSFLFSPSNLGFSELLQVWKRSFLTFCQMDRKLLVEEMRHGRFILVARQLKRLLTAPGGGGEGRCWGWGDST
jgi:hypothetical protein